MDYIQSLYLSLRVIWRDLLPGTFERSCANTLLFATFMYLVVLAIERIYGTRTNHYQSRDFVHDLVYYLYYRSGVPKLLYIATILIALELPLSFLDLKLLASLPFGVQAVLWLLIGDCAMYWFHRAQHHYRFLWAFHTTHHAEEHLTFASFLRFHPVEVFIGEILTYIILRILGFNLNSWVAAYLVTSFLGEIQHTQIPWKFGPLYKVIVSPSFHAYHHSRDRTCHDKNYGGLFSFWDYLFGTAVADGVIRPDKYGLADVKVTSLWSTLITPFGLLRNFYFPGRLAKDAPAPQGLKDQS